MARFPLPTFALALALGTILPASAASFSITNASTTAQTLGGGSGQTGTLSSTGSLTVNGSTVAVTLTGNNASLTNSGTLSQTGTGRAIRDNTGVSGFTLTNNLGALIQTADADVIQMNKTPAGITLNNYGTMNSLNATKGGAQAVDFTAILSGGNTINNYATGILQAADADAVRPGVNGLVFNSGTIKASSGSGSGISVESNSGVQITNEATGLIEGAEHGISGTAASSTAFFNTTITNNSGGILRGNDGSGINLGGFNARETVTITNHGTITGNGVTGDGDGIDVDGLLTLINTGTIRSLNAFSSTTSAESEGITTGGGTITNYGLIEGAVATGNTNANGRGITISGLSTPTVTDPIYGNTVITNKNGGQIKGRTSGITVDGPANTSGYTVTITNEAGGTIQGSGPNAAALRTGADNDTVNNSGLIQAVNSGKAIDLGSGTNTLNILGGTASVLGDITGGTGLSNVMTIDPGSGNFFTYSGAISNFRRVEIKSGTVTLSGLNSYTGDTLVTGGTLALSIATLADSADVSLVTGSQLILYFAGTDTIDELRINGLLQATGTWGGLASAATHKTALISGNGLLNVTGPPTPYDAWAVDGGLDGSPTLPAGVQDDPDHDGVTNLMEYATRMTPSTSDTVPQSLTQSGGGLDYTYTVNKAATDVTYVVQWSDTLLGDWSTSGTTPPTLVPGSDNGLTQQLKVTVPPGSGRRFVRLKVTRP